MKMIRKMYKRAVSLVLCVAVTLALNITGMLPALTSSAISTFNDEFFEFINKYDVVLLGDQRNPDQLTYLNDNLRYFQDKLGDLSNNPTYRILAQYLV